MDEVVLDKDKDYGSVEVHEKWYEWVKVCATRAIPFADLIGLHGPEFEISEELDGLVIKLQSYILSDKLEPTTVTERKTVKIKIPATWWDLLKQTYWNKWWFPSKLLKPHKNKTVEQKVEFKVEVQPMLTYPQAQVPQPVLGRPFKVYMTRVIRDDN